jgi:hypothetical protein
MAMSCLSAGAGFMSEDEIMGMFDSFFVEVDGRELELQSKRFESVLGQYRSGDFVAGCLPGVRVFFESLFLDQNGNPMYGADRETGLKKTVFIILVEGVFVDHQVHDGELSTDGILATLRQLQARWNDSARVLAFMSDALRQRQHRIAELERRLGRAKSIIATARRLRAGETLDNRFDLIWEENKKLAAGDDPLEVMAWALEQKDARGWTFSEGALADPLEEFRL